MIRKVLIIILVVLPLLTVINVSYSADNSLDLSSMKTVELYEFIDDIDKEIELHYVPDSNINDDVLEVVKKTTESIYSEKGIVVSWAWYDSEYEYARERDLYAVGTHLDYTDSNNQHQQREVTAWLFPDKSQYKVFYLEIGEEIIIDLKAELPESLWASSPSGVITKTTGLDLSSFQYSQLLEMRTKIVSEIKKNHTAESKVSDWVLYLVKLEVEQTFSEDGINVSWAWTEYEYNRDWEFYSLKTHVDYKDKTGANKQSTVYAEAFPRDGRYALYYLTVGDQTLIDVRNQLPLNLSNIIGAEDAVISFTPVPTSEPSPTLASVWTITPTPESASLPISEPTSIPTQKPTLIPTQKPASVPSPKALLTVTPTHTPEQKSTSELEKDNKADNMVKIIHKGSVNVRKQSTADSEKVGAAEAGAFYEYIETSQNGWYKIRLENGVVGWVSGKMAELKKGDTFAAIEQKTADKSKPYTYKGPKYEIVDSHDTGIGLMQYWVYTKKLDHSTDEYRDQVKAILTDVARNIDNDKVLIDVVTDKEVAYFESFNTYQQYLDEYGWDYMTDIVLPKEEKHWIASYTGGYDEVQSKRSEEDSAYGIYWFIAEQTPRDDTTSEQWRPDMRIKLTDSSSISKPTARPTAKPESKKTDKPTQKSSKEEIDLAASQVIIELVINDVNKILGFDAITSYSIRDTGFIYFYLSYDFVRISNSERQVFLDAINKAFYTQIYGSGTPYSEYKYYVGDTLIAENKMFDPESVKLR